MTNSTPEDLERVGAALSDIVEKLFYATILPMLADMLPEHNQRVAIQTLQEAEDAVREERIALQSRANADHPTRAQTIREKAATERWLARRRKVITAGHATHQKVSHFGDDTCLCGYDGWPCPRATSEPDSSTGYAREVRPQSGNCPECGTPDNQWCAEGCSLIDYTDYR